MMKSMGVDLFVAADGKELPLFSQDLTLQALNSYLCADYLVSTVTEIGECGVDRVLVHGQPMAVNLILQGREKVIAILDWTSEYFFVCNSPIINMPMNFNCEKV